jgi:arabinose-5-phosphate isomerase
MSCRPATVPREARLRVAVALLDARRLSELPVIDADGRPVGLLDIVDLVGLLPPAATAVAPDAPDALPPAGRAAA